MSEKKYYWIKLRPAFFQSKEIKKLRRIAGGDTFVIIYLKMQLLSLETEGKLYFDGLEEEFAEELALTLDEDADNVKMTIAFLEKCGMIEQKAEDEYFLPEALQNTGKESASAQRVRKHRALQSNTTALQCNTIVTKSNTEKEIEKEIELELEREGEKETAAPPSPALDKLIYDYGVIAVDDYIGRVKNWHYSNGKKQPPDIVAVARKWMEQDKVTKIDHSMEKYEAMINNF